MELNKDQAKEYINSIVEELQSDKIHKPQEVADMLGVTRATVLNLIKRGDLQAIRISTRKIFITDKAIAEYLQKRATTR